jgi:hypothetical protein
MARSVRSILLAVSLLVLPTASSAVLAQGSLNPYGNNGFADYREFSTPMYANNPALPGQARLESQGIGGGRARPNQFDQFSESLDGDLSGTTRRAAPGTQYYNTYRQYDQSLGRVYRPNDTKADREFEQQLRARNERYSSALKEKDPARRMKLLRQLEVGTLGRPVAKSARPAGAVGATAAGSAATAPRAAATAPAGRAPSPFGTPGARRSAPPSPYFNAPGTARAATPAASGTMTAPATMAPATPTPSSIDPGSVPVPAPR